MKALIVGLGIGQLYKTVLSNLNFEIDTVDSDKSKTPTFTQISDVTGKYDIAVICTPNFTHDAIARSIANKSKIILIEKPGLSSADKWTTLVSDYPNTRFMMVKNNQYRDSINYFKSLVKQSTVISVIWNNKNRIPNPGSWFTTKELAFGGVSRDLMPHMLSYFCVIDDFSKSKKYFLHAEKRYTLETIDSTDYGVVNKNGTYDVDDVCEMRYLSQNKSWIFRADWKSDTADDVYIQFDDHIKIPLGLCPESAYQEMINTAIKNLYNDEFWQGQYSQDIWIHQQIGSI